MKIESWQLKQRQNLPLSVKIELSNRRIVDWYVQNDGKVYISFSGGKDSLVLLHLVRQLYPEIEAVFIDTGLEYPEIRDFVKTVPNVKWLKPKFSFFEVLKKYGYPVISKEQAQFIEEYRNSKSQKIKDIRIFGNKHNRGKISKKWLFLLEAPFKISSKCCNIMKKNPAKKYEKETGNVPFLGTRVEDSALRRQSYLKNGCNSFTGRKRSMPLAFWTTEDIWSYIKQNQIPYCAIYDRGCDRTGCVFCLFGIHKDKEPNRFQLLKQNHPRLWEYCMYKLGIKEILDFLKIKAE